MSFELILELVYLFGGIVLLYHLQFGLCQNFDVLISEIDMLVDACFQLADRCARKTSLAINYPYQAVFIKGD